MTQFPTALLDGYQAFKSQKYAQEAARYQQLAKEGQTPQTLVIACCDSRAAPEVIFNATPGEIFVVRNVANLVPPYCPDGEYHSTSAALEFAIQALKVKDVVVMGHGRCGGVRAALDPASEPLSPGDFIGKWMELLGPPAAVITNNEWMTDVERQTALERISVRHSIGNLMTFPWIEVLHKGGKLNVHGAWFDISSGELWTMDAETGDFTCVT